MHSDVNILMVVNRSYRNEECIAQQFEVVFHKRLQVICLYYLFRVPSVLVSENYHLSKPVVTFFLRIFDPIGKGGLFLTLWYFANLISNY